MALALISLIAWVNCKSSSDGSLLISRIVLTRSQRTREEKSRPDFDLLRKFTIVTLYQTNVSIESSIASSSAKEASTGIEFALVCQGQQGIHSIERYRPKKRGPYTISCSLSGLNVNQ